jgi:catechol 2,3-dioxygenase-like lactoylglutathione lyase family enzyme
MKYPLRAAWLIIFFLGANEVARGQSPVQAIRVGCPSISVASVGSAAAFYTGVLDFRVKDTAETSIAATFAPGASWQTTARSVELVLGSECLILAEYNSPKGRPFPEDSRANDFWFEHVAIVVSDMDSAFARLKAAHVRFVSNFPQTLPTWNKDAAGISAFYFRDPDGHYLELIHFPQGKGQAKWQRFSESIFSGIDHTAIAVSDTRRSLAFYRDALHMQVTGSSENYGTEQEHLSGIFNAHLLITSLRTESGIGIELLEYLSPSSGRPIPPDLAVWDIACWQIRMDIKKDTTSLSASHPLHDATWIKLPQREGGTHEATWIKDPDGHLLELVQQ